MEISDQRARDRVNVRYRQTWGRKTRNGLVVEFAFYPGAGLLEHSRICMRSPLIVYRKASTKGI